MKTRLVEVDQQINTSKELFEALLSGKVVKVSSWDLELLPSGKLNIDLVCSLGALVAQIHGVYERVEQPWYDCMEVGQTVLCKALRYGTIRFLTKIDSNSWYWNFDPRAETNTVTLDDHIPLTQEEVSKFAFDNVINGDCK